MLLHMCVLQLFNAIPLKQVPFVLSVRQSMRIIATDVAYGLLNAVMRLSTSRAIDVPAFSGTKSARNLSFALGNVNVMNVLVVLPPREESNFSRNTTYTGYVVFLLKLYFSSAVHRQSVHSCNLGSNGSAVCS